MPLPSCICVAGRPPFERLGDIFCALSQIDLECVVPTLLSATINIGVVTLVFDVAVTGGIGFTGMVETTPAVFTYVSGSGSTTLTFDSDTSAEEGDTVTLDYSPGDIANGDCLLAAISDFPVTNNTGLQFEYLRPGGVDGYFRPGGVDTYIRP